MSSMKLPVGEVEVGSGRDVGTMEPVFDVMSLAEVDIADATSEVSDVTP